MLVDSICSVRPRGVVAGVDTSKVQAMPIVRHVSKDFSINSFTNNPDPEPARVKHPKNNSVVGKFLNIFA